MSEITDIRYFTDGEQATAAVLNRPAKDLAIVDSVMSKVQFEANAAARREQYAGSGFVEWGKENFNTVNKGMYIRSDEKDHLQLSYGDITKVNINGNLTRINAIMNNTNTNVIRFPQASSAQTITDSTNAPAMNQGDFAILKDLDRELVENGTFDTGIDGWAGINSSLSYDSDNKRLYVELNDFGGVKAPVVNFIKGVKYTFLFKVTFDTAASVYCNSIYYGSSRVSINASVNAVSGELVSVTFIAPTTGAGAMYLADGSENDGKFWVDDVSLTQASEEPIVALSDINANVDIYENTDKFKVRDSISRQDLVFLETWHENVADKDIVYPYGNIQYRGRNTDGLSGIADGTFTGAGTYSLFGNWQSENDLVGKGYKWSDLSLVDKVKFASNHDNNVYRDGNNWVQVRYRIRVVQGLGNDGIFDGRKHYGICLSNGSNRVAVKGPATLACDNYDRPNGLPRPYNKYIWSESNYNERHQQIGTYSSDDKGRGGDAMALPIASVQRRNVGIYDESFNPEGTAKVYVDGAAVYSYETNLINSMDDCFDRGNIAAINPDNGDVSRLSAGTEGHVSTGSIASGVSGRPDGIYYDEVNERDVEDLRMSAHKRNYDELREEYKNKAISGRIRGKESSYISKTATFWFSSSTTVNEKNGGIYIWDDISKFYLSSSRGEYNGKLILENGQNENNKWREFFVEYIDINGDSLGFYKAIEHSYTDQFHTEKPINAVGMKVRYYYATGLTQNNTITHCDIIGDPRKISQRIKLDITADTTQTIKKNDYFLCTLTDNNGGTAGHYYRYLSSSEITGVHTNTTDGTANATDGHIDFSDTDIWIDLGSDGSIGGYSQKWLDNGVDGSPLIVGENGDTILPVAVRNYTANDLCAPSEFPIYIPQNSNGFYGYFGIKLSRKNSKIKKVLVSKKDGSFERYIMGGWSTKFHAETRKSNYNSHQANNIMFNIDKSYEDLGYASIQEMLDLMIVKVYYETKANFLELVDNNYNILSLNNVSCINGYGNHNHLINSSINKVSTGESSGYIGTSGLKLYATRPEGGFATETSWSSYVSPTHDSKLFGNKIPSNSPMIKFFDYLTVSSNRARLQFVFKELKYDTDSSTWGDDNKFQIIDKISTVTDQNGNSVLYGQKAVNLPYFIGGN